MRPPGSLRARITIAAVLAVALAGAVAGTVLVAAVERDGRTAVDSDLRARVARIAPSPAEDDRFGGRGPRGRAPERLLVGSGTFAQVAYGGEVVDQGGDVPADAPAVPDRVGFSTVEIDGGKWRSLTMPIAGPAGCDGRLRAAWRRSRPAPTTCGASFS